MRQLAPLIIESLVAMLLIVAICYCAILDRRLKRIRLNGEEMRRTIAELGGATDRAEKAVEALREAVLDCDNALGDRLRLADRKSEELSSHLRAAGDVMARISRIVAAGASR